ncbi:MAG: arylsulfatase [Verrucomicrobia bacterium]|nr:arylsulfatase [Verrucomicrobiota bacterium]
MKRKIQHLGLALFGAVTLATVGFSSAQAAESAAQQKLPNIVYIMADDLGYNDLSCQGATKVTTPGIDRLAKEGMRFTDAHTPAALCSPSRYGVLTGRYPWRRSSPNTWGSPGAALLIEPGRMTTASLLKQAGYTTGVVGKWHLGFGTKEKPVDWNGELKPGPLEVGFDYFFGDIANRHGCYVENHRIVGLTPDDPVKFNGGRHTGGKAAFTMKNEDNAEVLHNKAVAFIEKNKDRPFYLHYVPNNVHTPLTPNQRFQGTSQCGVYGDFVKELDWSVGEILATLDRLGLAENTLVIFTSDNGGVYEAKAFAAGHRCCAPLNGQKADIWDGGSRVPFLARWPGHIPTNATSAQVLCIVDMLATFAAVTGQTLPPDAGPDSFNQLPAMLGQTLAAPTRPNLIVQSGKDTVSNKKPDKKVEIWAVREGKWKLVLGQGPGYSTMPGRGIQLRFDEVGMTNSDHTAAGKLKPGAPPLQLYDLDADLGETQNLYLDHHDVVARLKKLYKELVKNGRSRP